MLNDKEVYIKKTNILKYPNIPPFNPKSNYPEYPFSSGMLDPDNLVYESIRELLCEMGLDSENYGKELWNPFKDLIYPGNMVLIKPNMVLHKNQLKQFSLESVITNGSIIRAIIDYVYIALKGTGRIIIADAPIQSCDFEIVIDKNGIKKIQELYREKGFKIELIDFRKEKAVTNNKGQIVNTKDLPGDPRGYTIVNLGQDSMLSEVSSDYEKFRVTNYDSEKMKEHHNKDTHEYLIPNSVLEADVIINLPKPKTHRKAGITGAMKNLVGINGSKDWLPHHRTGSTEERGDEYIHRNIFKKINVYLQERIDKYSRDNRIVQITLLRLIQKANGVFRKTVFKDRYLEGSWWGNDTIWRTVCDLNRLLIYADRQGVMQSDIQRKLISFLDMIISGEKEGPLKPTPKEVGVIVAGINPLVVDSAISAVMGFDYKKIPNINNAYTIEKFPIACILPQEIIIHSNHRDWDGFLKNIKYENSLKYKATSGWEGHIEL